MNDWPRVERALVARSVLTFHRRGREELPRGVLIGSGRLLGFFDPDDRSARHAVPVDVEDLGDSVLMPGFVDAHNHQPSAVFDTLSVRTAMVRSTAELLECLTRATLGSARDRWLVTEHALSVQQLDGGRAPVAAVLDTVPGGRPIAVRIGAHAMALNTRALEMAGIAALKTDPPGGIIERDGTGAPNGVIREYGATRMVYRCVDPRPRSESLGDAIRHTQRDYARSGVTTVRVTGLRPGELADFHQVLVEDGHLATRVCGGPRIDPTASPEEQFDALSSWPAATGFGDEWLSHDAAKIFVDHGIETVAHGGSADPLMPQQQLDRLVAEAARLGWAVACHAVARPAVDMVLRAFARARSVVRRPLVLEHGFDISDEQLSTIGHHGFWWSTQPAIIGIELSSHATALRTSRLVPLRSAQRLGVRCALGSDWNALPGTGTRPFPPMRTVRLCVERQSLWGQDMGSAETIDAETALYLHTRAPAELIGRDDLGALAPGACADLVALSADPTVDPSADIRATWVGGRAV